MKMRIVAMFAIIAVFGLAIAAYAYTNTSNSIGAKPSCCAKSDSCPMKAKKDHEKSGGHAGESCPMKNAGGEQCCCCCGADSCPMKKDGEARATAVSATDDGKNCCCDCCKEKAKANA